MTDVGLLWLLTMFVLWMMMPRAPRLTRVEYELKWIREELQKMNGSLPK